MTEAAVSEKVSPLAQLKDRREQIAKAQKLKLKVPRWDNPEIWVEYEPADYETVRRGQIRLEKVTKNRPDEELNANADLLVKHCVRVFAILDGAEYSLRPDDPHGDPTRFDPDLAANLGLEENATARATARKLFITDGDLLSHAQDLIRWSGIVTESTDRDYEGESPATT